MADPLLSVRAGAADPPTMALPPGQAIGPLSVGRAGTWRVVAPGVLEEHAFLYFNGTDLFLQSANPNSPVTVNGAPIPGDWTPVYAPCEISIGGARVWFGPPETARSRPPAAPSRPPPPAASRPFMPRVHGIDQDDEHTRLQPIEEIQASRPRAAPPAHDQVGATLKSPVSMGGAPPSVGAPTFNPATEVMGPGPLFGPPPPMAMGGEPVAPLPGAEMPPGMPPPAAMAPPKKESWIGARWREASTPKKALMVLLLPLIWAVWVIFTDKPPPARPAKPAASASASPSAKPSAGAPSASATVAAQPPPTPPAPASTPSGKAAAASSATPASTTKTPQREAADAVAVGAYDRAARLYEELAKAHPDVPAYAEAARIMKAKTGKR
jgi:hypothetical protein